ncbi:MAG TPA: OmpA family protein [Terriglobales bacterium]|jgi:OOP family OmpA-OmpF porin|nr:OmpA family protein [Terriglobales bacterium]
MNRRTIVVSLTALLFLASASVLLASDDKTEVKGMITARTGETLIVNSGQGSVTVVLTDDTVTKDDKGLFGLDKQHLSSVVLIPGLKVEVKGTSDGQGRVVANTITTDGDDLETAEMIQAGLHPTAQQVQANVQAIAANQKNIASNKVQLASQKQEIDTNQQNIAANQQKIAQNMKDIEENTNRFTALSEYDVKGQATVNFNVGSSSVSAKDKEELSKLAQSATGLTGYIIEVTGYTDSTGSAAMNTELSENRAQAVINYLVQQGNIPVRHIVAPGAMGEYGSAASNETKAGRAENRRVEVKVLVNKGIAGS